MAKFTLYGEINISYRAEVEADSEEEALQKWDSVYPGLPYLGDEWDECEVSDVSAELHEEEEE